MSTKLRAGVVGVGSMGWNHARIYGELDNAELSAVYDANTAAAEKAVRKYGGRVAASLDDLVGTCDAVSVAAPPNLHHEIVMKLLAAGKHVLVEKPIAENPEQAAEMADLARDKGLVLQVGHIERFNPALDALEQDQDFLLRGDVFTEDVIDTWIWYKTEHEVRAVRERPHPYEFALYFDI